MTEKEALLQELKELYPDVFQHIMEDLSGNCWTTDELIEEFDIDSFMAPFCFGTHRNTGQKGSLTFIDQPRIYYRWRPC